MKEEKSGVSLKKKMSSLTQRSSQTLALPDYNVYKFSGKELTLYIPQSLIILIAFSHVFYRSLIALVLLSSLLPFLIKRRREICIKRRKERLTLEFREMLVSIITSLVAGYSIENAYIMAFKDMCLLFGEDSYIAKELSHISKGLRNNMNIETLMEDFANRSHISDIKDFAEVFKIAKHSGGNLPSMIRRTATIISDKLEIKQRILTVISAKRLEQKIMNYIPFAIILYIDMTSPGYFDSLYHNPVGIIIMTVLFGIYLFAYQLSEKITNISI